MPVGVLTTTKTETGPRNKISEKPLKFMIEFEFEFKLAGIICRLIKN